jgi:glycosyltransferase involved in cell wall biosynthesis
LESVVTLASRTLLTPEALVPPNDVNALAGTIHKLVNSSELRARLSLENLERAKDYTEENLRERRVEFYEHVRDATAAWNAKRQNGLPRKELGLS